MNASNRFEIETLALQQQAEIQRRLRGRVHMAELDPSSRLRRRPNVRLVLVVAATTIASAILALGVSTVTALGLVMLR